MTNNTELNCNQRSFKRYVDESMTIHSQDIVRSLQAVGRYAPPEVSIPFSRLTTSEKNQVIYEVLKNEFEK